MLDKMIQERIDQLYRDMKPLHDQFGMKPKTIEERYREIEARKQMQKMIPKPKFKLPKL